VGGEGGLADPALRTGDQNRFHRHLRSEEPAA
jgi:hypothetical protein